MKPHERIIFPVDVSNINLATELVGKLGPYVGMFKFGFESLYSMIADFVLSPEQNFIAYAKKVRTLCKMMDPKKIFLDVKLHDIPNTVEKATQALARLQARILNLHVSGGSKMVEAMVKNRGASKVFGVTVLTSISAEECFTVFGDCPENKVFQFAHMLRDTGADGVICAPKEGLMLRKDRRLDKLQIATPNIRPWFSLTPEERERVKDDQNHDRQMTPGLAVRAGIDYLVIGRPISNPPPGIGGPVEAAKLIAEEIEKALEKEVVHV